LLFHSYFALNRVYKRA